MKVGVDGKRLVITSAIGTTSLRPLGGIVQRSRRLRDGRARRGAGAE